MSATVEIAGRALPYVDILGARVHGPTRSQAVDIVEQWIRRHDGRTRMVVVTGFHGLWVGHQDADFRRILNAADLFVPDGIAPVWLSRLHGRPLPGRVAGQDLMQAFLERSDRAGYRSFFYGDTPATLDALATEIGRHFPGARTAGTISPPFRALTDEEETVHVERINAAAPDVLWVGLGLPKQDRWIARNLHRLQVPVAIGVGAAFRFQAGTASRGPKWLRDAGFEWVWRFAASPGKLWRRDLIDGPRFVVAALGDVVRARRRAKVGPWDRM